MSVWEQREGREGAYRDSEGGDDESGEDDGGGGEETHRLSGWRGEGGGITERVVPDKVPPFIASAASLRRQTAMCGNPRPWEINDK